MLNSEDNLSRLQEMRRQVALIKGAPVEGLTPLPEEQEKFNNPAPQSFVKTYEMD